MKNTFHFRNFFPDFFGHVGKPLDEKAKFNFKINELFYRETKSYYTHVISKGKGNQTMKFTQLIEYNTKNIF